MRLNNIISYSRHILCGLVIIGAAHTVSGQVSFGHPEKFNEGWKFILADDSIAARPDFDASALRPDYDDSKWRQLSLPHDWSVEQPLSPSLASGTGYLPGGIGWYRKHFIVNDTLPKHYIYFEGAYNRSEVYLNGHLLGKRPSGYASFMYDMTPWLKEGDNVIAVRIDHSRYADSRYYTGSGIYRDVYMISAADTHIAQWGIGYEATKVTDRKATVKINVAVENPIKGLDVKVSVADADGKKIASASAKAGTTNTLTLNIPNPHRWSLESPYLYRMTTTLSDKGRVIDEAITNIGIRTLDFDPDKGFALNGKWTKVKGVCLHHDAGALGAAVPEEVWERRLRNLKEIGVNAIRMSHNPQAPVVYDLCDRLGLLVMDEATDEWEFPKRKWVKGWNVGTPSYDGTYDFFEEWIDRDVADMVRRDRNHPSVILWSIGNEVDYPNDPYSHPILDGSSISQPMYGGYNPDAPNAERIGKIAKRLANVVKSIDTSRPTTGALAGVVMSNETEYPDAVDVVGYNYTEDRYDIDHAKYPDRVIYGSENRPDIDAWYAVRDKDFIFGQFIWTGTDYLGESGRWPSRGFYTGLLDFGSFVKPRGHFRAALWSDKPVTYIGTYPVRKGRRHGNPEREWLSMDAWDTWNYEQGDSIRVVCYTNAPFARLTLNGKTVGDVKPYDPKTGIIHWDIPYSPGTLRAEGTDADGKVLSDYSISTSGRPYELMASSDIKDFSHVGQTAHVVVEILDEEGNIVKLGDNDIRCIVEGPAELLALEGSNNSDMSDYTDNRQRAFRGRLLAYIRSTGNGPVTVRFSSPLLKGCSLNM